MKLVVFGATGTVGREVVQQALAAGHSATAFTRTPDKLELSHTNLSCVQGDVLNLEDVERAVKGHDIVLCTLGAGAKGGVRAAGTHNILKAMRSAGVQRFIAQTTLGVGDSRHNLSFYWRYIMFGVLLRQVYKDHVLQEQYIEASGLDWVIIRPAAFTNGARTGNYQHGFAVNRRDLKFNISRADVADFMLKQLTDNAYLHQTPGLSY